MALEFIVPSALPEATTVPDGAAIPMDTGLGEVQKATPAQIVATGRPLASEAQARAGTSPTTAITPLTLRQGVQTYLAAEYGINEATAAEIVASVTRAQEWAENPVDDPVETGKYSARHHATKAGGHEAGAMLAAGAAEQSAINSALNDPTLQHKTIALLQASTRLSAGSGAVWRTVDGLAYEEAAPGEPDPDLTTAGDVPLWEFGPFSTRARFVAALARGFVPRVGDVIRAGGREYQYMGAPVVDGPPDLPGYRPHGVVTPEHWADNAVPGTTDMTAAVNGAMRFAATYSRRGQSSGTYLLTGTVSPLGRLVWDMTYTVLKFDLSVPPQYTEIMHNPAGAALTGTGLRLGFDLIAANSNVIIGHLQITSTASVPTMTAANRAGIPVGFVAWGASQSGGAFSTFEALEITAFDRPEYRGNWGGDYAPTALPYTGVRIGSYYIHRCLKMPYSGQTANGFDTRYIDVLRMARNAGEALIRTTELVCGQLFTIGLAAADVEAETVTLTVDSATVTLSSDNPHIAVGTTLACVAGGLNKAGGSIGYVATVTAKEGTTLTMDKAPAADATCAFVIGPPSISVLYGTITAQSVYIEGNWDRGFDLGVGGSLVTPLFKLSGGPMAYRYGAPITVRGRERCSVIIGSLHKTAENSIRVASAVAVGSSRDSALHSAAIVDIGTSMTGAAAEINSDMISVVSLREADIDAEYIDAAAVWNPRLQLIRRYADKTSWLAPIRGAGLAVECWSQSLRGGLETAQIADISAATGTLGFSDPVSGVVTKTPGSAGRLRLFCALVAGATYRVTITTADWVAGSPALHQNSGSGNLNAVGIPFARAGGTWTLFVVALAGADGLAIQGFVADNYKITRFDVARVLT